MIAYKGFTKDLWSRLGDDKEENCRFVIGETKKVSESKTARSGFHCCENPFSCLGYYDLDGQNRFFKVEAAGDIDEDESERIACTKITLLEELDTLKFAVEGMRYIILHQDRDGWKKSYRNVVVNADEAETKEGIAIARGRNPMVKGREGCVLGVLRENENGEIVNATIVKVKQEESGKWFRIGKTGKLEVVE